MKINIQHTFHTTEAPMHRLDHTIWKYETVLANYQLYCHFDTLDINEAKANYTSLINNDVFRPEK